MKIYLVRHGQTLFNQQKKVQGWCDSPLTQEGIQQAKELWIQCIIFYKIEMYLMLM